MNGSHIALIVTAQSSVCEVNIASGFNYTLSLRLEGSLSPKPSKRPNDL